MPAKNAKGIHFVPKLDQEDDFVVKQSSITSPFVCFICQGYLVEAVSIVTCLDTFCRSCILHHIEKGRLDCPKCSMIMHPTTPLTVLKFDSIKQGLVNKLFPHIEICEKQRKELYYRSKGIPYPPISENRLKRKFKTWKEGLYFVRNHKLGIFTVIINYAGPSDPNLREYPPLEKKYLRIPETARIHDLIQYITCSLRIHKSNQVSIFLKNCKCNPKLELWKVYQKQKQLNMPDALPKSDGMKILRVEYAVIKKVLTKLGTLDPVDPKPACQFLLQDIRVDQKFELERMSHKTNRYRHTVNSKKLLTSYSRNPCTFKYPSKINLLQKRYASLEKDSLSEPFLNPKNPSQSTSDGRTFTCIPYKRKRSKLIEEDMDVESATSKKENTSKSNSSFKPPVKFASKILEKEHESKNYIQSPVKSNDNGLKIKIKIEPKITPPKTSKQDLDDYYKFIDKTARDNAANRLDKLKLNNNNKLIKQFYMQFFIEERRLLMSNLKKASKQKQIK